ncbi:hypothetical protein J3R83DRAFT_10979 [Lanmaoa asiatica]|nr:hypothetical protein J3R83DRAFT_10979 [Lanmaoa asiatica]
MVQSVDWANDCSDRCEESGKSTRTSWSLAHAKTFQQSAPIVDFAWYPGASQHNLPAFCFVASVRDCPVKLLDGRDGRVHNENSAGYLCPKLISRCPCQLRASYPIVDHRERHIAPHSLAFNLPADKLYCGFENAIEIFDVQRPSEGERLLTTPSKKSKDGLKGIISTLAFSCSPEYYAAGSLTPASRVSDNITLFNESALEPVLSIGGVAGWEKGGVTQLTFNPTRPHILYATFRRSERLWGWDLRGDPSVPLCYFSREVVSDGSGHKSLTNQRRRFDVEGTGRWLASGNQVCLWVPLSSVVDIDRCTVDIGHLNIGLPADAVGAVAFHPLEPLLLSVSGSRHFDDATPVASASEDSESDSELNDESRENVGVVRRKERPRPSVTEASIKLWDLKGPECM